MPKQTTFGFGVKRTFSKNFVEDYTNRTKLWEAVMNIRQSWFTMNLTYETVSIGHASKYDGQPDEKFEFKQIDYKHNIGSGSADINSLYMDLGLEVNNILMALGGLVVDE